MTHTIQEITEFLETFAPLELAEEWDNVGLLLGDTKSEVRQVMTCLTLTADVAQEAIEKQVQLVVTHHPVLFRPIQRITSETVEGKLLLDLIQNNVAVYSPHTAFDSARDGINFQIANALGLSFVQPLRPHAEDTVGSGRHGVLDEATTLKAMLAHIKAVLKVPYLQYTGDLAASITKVGIACGAAGEFLRDAHIAGCGLFITGETRFHTCLEARSLGIAMIQLSHYVSERHAVEQLVQDIHQQFPDLKVWASTIEEDPLKWSVS